MTPPSKDSEPGATAYTFRAAGQERLFEARTLADAFEKANEWVREAGLAPESFAWFDGGAANSYSLGEYGVWD
jgi:hypothetical protein